MKGKLIVIDGIDGSGKATQTKLLAGALKKVGYKVKTIDFPRYQDNLFGGLIGECLSGLHGDFVNFDPKVASILYAADRFESSKEIRNWIDKGYVVVTDRYVSANEIHQGGKIEEQKKRKEFFAWLEKVEFGIFGIPKPDLIVYLDVPTEVSTIWLKNKMNREKKDYLKGRKDVVESNLRYIKNSRASALYLAKENKNWVRIECCKGGVSQLPEVVSEYVVKEVLKVLPKIPAKNRK